MAVKLTIQEEQQLKKKKDEDRKKLIDEKEAKIEGEVNKVINEFKKTKLRGEERTELIRRIKEQLK